MHSRPQASAILRRSRGRSPVRQEEDKKKNVRQEKKKKNNKKQKKKKKKHHHHHHHHHRHHPNHHEQQPPPQQQQHVCFVGVAKGMQIPSVAGASSQLPEVPIHPHRDPQGKGHPRQNSGPRTGRGPAQKAPLTRLWSLSLCSSFDCLLAIEKTVLANRSHGKGHIKEQPTDDYLLARTCKYPKGPAMENPVFPI